MTEAEYRRVRNITRKAVFNLSSFEMEEIVQEAAIAAFRYGLSPSTRVFWAARDAYRDLRGTRRIVQGIDVPTENVEAISPVDPEEMALQGLLVEQMMACLSPMEKFIVRAVDLDGWKQQEVADYLQLHNSTINRRRRIALKKIRAAVAGAM